MNSTTNTSSLYLEAPTVTTTTKYIVLTSCLLSAFCSLFIIATFYLWSEIQRTSRKLLVYLSWADLFVSVGYGYGVYRNYEQEDAFNDDCVFQSALSTYFQTSAFVWTVAIAVYLYLALVKDDIEEAEQSVCYVHIVAWACPAPLIAAAAAFGNLGNDHSYTTVGWCWIKLSPDFKPGLSTFSLPEIIWMLVTEKAWELVAFVSLPTLCVLIKRGIRIKCSLPYYWVHHHPEDIAAMRKIDKKLLWIPLTFIFLRTWSILRFVVAVTDLSSPLLRNTSLMTLQGVCSSSQGTVNFILFCLGTKKVRKRMYKLLHDLFRLKAVKERLKMKHICESDNEKKRLKHTGKMAVFNYSSLSNTSSTEICSSFDADV